MPRSDTSYSNDKNYRKTSNYGPASSFPDIRLNGRPNSTTGWPGSTRIENRQPVQSAYQSFIPYHQSMPNYDKWQQNYQAPETEYSNPFTPQFNPEYPPFAFPLPGSMDPFLGPPPVAATYMAPPPPPFLGPYPFPPAPPQVPYPPPPEPIYSPSSPLASFNLDQRFKTSTPPISSGPPVPSARPRSPGQLSDIIEVPKPSSLAPRGSSLEKLDQSGNTDGNPGGDVADTTPTQPSKKFALKSNLRRLKFANSSNEKKSGIEYEIGDSVWPLSKRYSAEGVLERSNVFACKRKIDLEGYQQIELDCFDGPSLDEELLGAPQFHWLHMQRKSMNLTEYDQMARNSPNMTPELKQLCVNLFDELRRDSVVESARGSFIEPGTVKRSTFRDSSDPETGCNSVVFFSFPHTEVSARTASNRNSQQDTGSHHMRTLFESFYQYESTEDRDSQQALKKYSKIGEDDIIYVPQLWATILGSKYLITCSPLSLSEMLGEHATVNTFEPNPRKGPNLLRIKDPLGRFHSLPLIPRRTFFDLERFIVSTCLADTDGSRSDYDVFCKDESPFTSARWLELLREEKGPIIELKIRRIIREPTQPHLERSISEQAHPDSNPRSGQMLALPWYAGPPPQPAVIDGTGYVPQNGQRLLTGGTISYPLPKRSTPAPRPSLASAPPPERSTLAPRLRLASAPPPAEPLKILGVAFDEDLLSLKSRFPPREPHRLPYYRLSEPHAENSRQLVRGRFNDANDTEDISYWSPRTRKLNKDDKRSPPNPFDYLVTSDSSDDLYSYVSFNSPRIREHSDRPEMRTGNTLNSPISSAGASSRTLSTKQTEQGDTEDEYESAPESSNRMDDLDSINNAGPIESRIWDITEDDAAQIPDAARAMESTNHTAYADHLSEASESHAYPTNQLGPSTSQYEVQVSTNGIIGVEIPLKGFRSGFVSNSEHIPNGRTEDHARTRDSTTDGPSERGISATSPHEGKQAVTTRDLGTQRASSEPAVVNRMGTTEDREISYAMENANTQHRPKDTSSMSLQPTVEDVTEEEKVDHWEEDAKSDVGTAASNSTSRSKYGWSQVGSDPVFLESESSSSDDFDQPHRGRNRGQSSTFSKVRFQSPPLRTHNRKSQTQKARHKDRSQTRKSRRTKYSSAVESSEFSDSKTRPRARERNRKTPRPAEIDSDSTPFLSDEENPFSRKYWTKATGSLPHLASQANQYNHPHMMPPLWPNSNSSSANQGQPTDMYDTPASFMPSSDFDPPSYTQFPGQKPFQGRIYPTGYHPSQPSHQFPSSRRPSNLFVPSPPRHNSPPAPPPPHPAAIPPPSHALFTPGSESRIPAKPSFDRNDSIEDTQQEDSIQLQLAPFLAWTNDMHRGEVEDQSSEARRSKDIDNVNFILDKLHERLKRELSHTKLYSSVEEVDLQKIRNEHVTKSITRLKRQYTSEDHTRSSDDDSWSHMSYAAATSDVNPKDYLAQDMISDMRLLKCDFMLTILRFKRLFVPLSNEHKIMLKCWGAINGILSSLDVNEIISPRPRRIWFVRGIDNEESLLARLGLRPPSYPIWACTDCGKGRVYNTKKSGLQHLWEFHFRASNTHLEHAGKFPKDALKNWLLSEQQLRFEKYSIELIKLLRFIEMRVEGFCTSAEIIQHGVAESESSKSDNYHLPLSLTELFESLVLVLLSANKSVSELLRYFQRWKYIDGPSSLQPRKNPDIEKMYTQYHRFFDNMDAHLCRAENDFLDMARHGTISTFVGCATVSPGYFLAFIISQLRTRAIRDDMDVTEFYWQCTNTLQFQVNSNPRKRLLREIHNMNEEIEILTRVNIWQTRLLEDFRLALDPATLTGDITSRSSMFLLEHPYIMYAKSSTIADSEQLSAMKERLLGLRDQAKQSIEILEEDHGKAIMVFTTVTIIFLPLSFVTSFFGMNTADIRNTDQGQRIFWSTGLPITIAVVAIALTVAYRGDQLQDSLRDLVERCWHSRKTEVGKVSSNSRGRTKGHVPGYQSGSFAGISRVQTDRSMAPSIRPNG